MRVIARSDASPVIGPLLLAQSSLCRDDRDAAQEKPAGVLQAREVYFNGAVLLRSDVW
jgi:hypothetical protein